MELIAALSTVISILFTILAVVIVCVLFWYKRRHKVRPKRSCFDSADGLRKLKLKLHLSVREVRGSHSTCTKKTSLSLDR